MTLDEMDSKGLEEYSPTYYFKMFVLSKGPLDISDVELPLVALSSYHAHAHLLS